RFTLDTTPLTKYDVNSRNGFLRVNLQNQDFLHNDYAYVLARQMNAAAMLAILDKDNHPIKVEGAVYYNKDNQGLVVFNSNEIKDTLSKSLTLSVKVDNDINGVGGIRALAAFDGVGNPILMPRSNDIRNIIDPFGGNLSGDASTLHTNIKDIND